MRWRWAAMIILCWHPICALVPPATPVVVPSLGSICCLATRRRGRPASIALLVVAVSTSPVSLAVALALALVVVGTVLTSVPVPSVLALTWKLADAGRGNIPFFIIPLVLNVECIVFVLGNNFPFEPLGLFLKVSLYNRSYIQGWWSAILVAGVPCARRWWWCGAAEPITGRCLGGSAVKARRWWRPLSWVVAFEPPWRRRSTEGHWWWRQAFAHRTIEWRSTMIVEWRSAEWWQRSAHVEGRRRWSRGTKRRMAMEGRMVVERWSNVVLLWKRHQLIASCNGRRNPKVPRHGEVRGAIDGQSHVALVVAFSGVGPQ